MDWKYIAGFFDGEGTLTKTEKRYRIYITQINFAVLDQIRKFATVGSVKKLTKRKEHWRDAWVFYITDKYKIQSFLASVQPHLIVKSQITAEALQEIEKKIQFDAKRKSIKTQRIKLIKKLRSQGFTYRDIGEKLNIDWGYARKLMKGLK